MLLLIAAPAAAGLRPPGFGHSHRSSAEAAELSWVEVRSSHFRVVSDAGADQARRVATELEKIRSVYQSVVGPELEPGDPILVFASADAEGFEALLPAKWREQGRTRWAGLFLEAPSGYTLLLRLDLRGDLRFRTVYHEYFHYLTRRNIGPLPPWLNEGLADYWATIDIRDEEILVGRPDYDYLALLKRKAQLPLETLFAAGNDSPHYRREETMTLFYAQSWALTHFLQSDEGRRRELTAYVSRLGGGADALQAARETFGDLDDLGEGLRKYIRSRRFHGARLSTPVLEDPTLHVRSLSEPEVEAARGTYAGGLN
jgi:hypothetical protein